MRGALRSMGVLVDEAEGDTVIDKYDHDGNGHISADELAHIVRDLEQLRRKYTTKEKTRRQSSMSRMPAPTRDGGLDAKIRKAFAVFDKNGDGTLDSDELKAILTKPVNGKPARFTPEEVDALIQKYDANGDGVLSIEEFTSAWSAISVGDDVELTDTELRA